jgi:hypothetical protein
MDAPWTIATLLSGNDPHWVERALRETHIAQSTLAGVGRVAAAAYPVFEERVAEVLRAALEIDLGGLALSAWARYRELVAAAERTRDAPGRPEDVVLAEHQITWTQHPAVEVIIDGAPVTTLQFDVAVSLTMRGVVAVVHAGMLAGLRFGDVLAGARLSIWERELAAREMQCLVGTLVRLGDGVPLVAGAAIPHPRHYSDGFSTADPSRTTTAL